jgi:hypothetical protein
MFNRVLLVGCLLFLFALAVVAAPSLSQGRETVRGAEAEEPKSAVAVAPSLTQEQAVQLAKDFCQRIGVPVTTPATVQYPSPQDTHWQARWRVVFNNQATAEVVGPTGDGCFYVNDALYERLARDNRPAGAAIPEAEAIRRATAVLAATGDAKELAFDKATLVQTHNPPLASCHTWIVSWTRQFQNVLYRHQGANMLLDAETGEVKIMCKNFPTPPPSVTVFKIRRDQATQVAVRKLAEAGVMGVSPVKVQAEIVRPNTFWMPEGNAVEEATISWVAWTCRFQIGEQNVEVWVDVETGSVIGGSLWGHRRAVGEKSESAFRNMPKAIDEFRQILKDAEEIKVYKRVFEKGKEWEDEPLVTLSGKSESKMFRLLKEKTRFPSEKARLRLVPNSKFVIVSKGKTYEVGYSFHGGYVLAAAPDQWGIVDEKFKDWLFKKLPASK